MAQNSVTSYVFAAACFWAALAFVCGFVLGTLRVFYLPAEWDQSLSPLAGLMGMALLGLVLAGPAARFHPALRRFALVSGGLAFAFLMLVRLALAEVMMGDSLARLTEQATTLTGLAELAGPLLFCLAPVLRFGQRKV